MVGEPSIGRRAEAEAVFARSGTVRLLGTRTQFSTPMQRTEWTRIVQRVGRVSGTQALGGLEVSGTDQVMMGRGMVLGKVISKVLGARTPIHDVVSLADTILYPIKAHVRGFGLALAGGRVGDAGCAVP